MAGALSRSRAIARRSAGVEVDVRVRDARAELMEIERAADEARARLRVVRDAFGNQVRIRDGERDLAGGRGDRLPGGDDRRGHGDRRWQSHPGAARGRFIGGTKGSHIVVAPFPGAPRDALYVEATNRDTNEVFSTHVLRDDTFALTDLTPG